MQSLVLSIDNATNVAGLTHVAPLLHGGMVAVNLSNDFLQVTINEITPVNVRQFLVPPGKDYYYNASGGATILNVVYQFVIAAAAAGSEDVTAMGTATIVGFNRATLEYFPLDNTVTPPGANLGSIVLSRVNAVAAGNVAAGAGRVSFTNVGTSAGSVMGVSIEVDETVEFSGWFNPATYTFLTLPVIPYVASATAILHINVSV